MSRLDQELTYYNVLSQLLDEVRDRAQRNPSDKRLGYLGLPFEKSRGDRRTALARYIDEIQLALDNAFLLRMVAAFESEAFARLDTAVGEARKTMHDHYRDALPFSRAASKLVRSDIRELKGLQDLIASYPGAPVDKLEGLRNHRNHVAHGGRVGTLSVEDFDLTDVHRTLSDLLAVVAGSRIGYSPD